MKYMGSKQRIAKHILPIILADRVPNQAYVEPFCGGCNSLDKVQNPRVANDSNKYLIALFKEMQSKRLFNPPEIDEWQYKHIRENKKEYEDWLVGYVGFNLSFAAKFFGGYARDKAGLRDYVSEARRNLVAQQKNIEGVEFTCGTTQRFLSLIAVLFTATLLIEILLSTVLRTLIMSLSTLGVDLKLTKGTLFLFLNTICRWILNVFGVKS